MITIDSHNLCILQGSEMLFSDFANGGPMWAGKGERQVRKTISFDRPFFMPPAVHVGFSLLDFDKSANTRLDISVDEITADDFTVIFKTWEDTRIARVRVDWMAIGAKRYEDEWDV